MDHGTSSHMSPNDTMHHDSLHHENSSTNHTTIITHHYYGLPVVVPLSMAMVVFMVVAFLGNIMVIMTIVRHRGMRTRTNMFIINLAVADILVAVMDMPFSLITIIHGDWIFGDGMCKFNGFTMALFLICSIHTLMYISIHKYISITRPFSRAMTPRRIGIMIAAAWTWSFICATGPLVGWNKIVYKEGASQCGPNLPTRMTDYTHSLFITTTNYFIPLSVMIFCYYHIFKEIHVHMQHIRETFNMNQDNSVAQQKKIMITLFFVLACFLLCWTPFVVYSTTLAFMKQKSKMPVIANPLAYWCGYMNSACNPVIYAFRSPSFRQGYKEIMCGKPLYSLSAENSLSFRSRSARGSTKSMGNATGNIGSNTLQRSQQAKRPTGRIRFLSQTSWMSLPLITFGSRSSESGSNSKRNNRKLSVKGSSSNSAEVAKEVGENSIQGGNTTCATEAVENKNVQNINNEQTKSNVNTTEVVIANGKDKFVHMPEDNDVFEATKQQTEDSDHYPKRDYTMQMSMESIQEENENTE